MMTWKSYLAAVCAACSIGCATPERVAMNSINASITTAERFVVWADLHRSQLTPEIAEVAEGVRTKAPDYWDAAYSALRAYKADGTEASKMSLTRGLARVDAIRESVEQARRTP